MTSLTWIYLYRAVDSLGQTIDFLRRCRMDPADGAAAMGNVGGLFLS